MDDFQPLSTNLIAAFERQELSCSSLGSPFTANLRALFAQHGLPPSGLRERMMAWQEDPTSSGDALPVRLCGALHELVLAGNDADLAAVYPPNHREDDGRLLTALSNTIGTHDRFLTQRLSSPPQTNEVRRSTAIYAALMHIADRTRMPLKLSEVGASAGLNLLLDRFHHDLGEKQHGSISSSVRLTPEWRGLAPKAADVTIEDRRGCDLSPFDLTCADDRTRLLSYVWADQAERLDRMRAAIDLAAQSPAQVDRADAVDWLDLRLQTATPGQAHVVYHTIAWQYLPDAAKRAGRAHIEAAGARATEEAPIFLVTMEDDGGRPGAALHLESWPGGSRTELARVDFHGRWIEWRV